MKRPLAGLLLPMLLLLAAACGRTEPEPEPEPPVPFADCAALTAPPAAGAVAPTGTSPATSGASPVATAVPKPAGSAQPVPDLSLPCFNGGAEVSLAAVRGPAVVNLWAAWCSPCRKELPAFQRLAERTGGQLHVIGVDTRDDRDAARDLATELGLTFPTLFDGGEKLRSALTAGPGIPITVFIDDQGRIRHVDVSGALDDTELATLVEQHLGVVVPA